MSYKARIREDAMRLNPMDDAMFQKMAEDVSFPEEILQVILDDKVLKVLDSVPQYSVKNLQGRSCILDVRCILSDGRIVNVEVQKANDDDHQRRVRYNGSLVTTNITDPGDKFKDVPDVIIIFISRFDVFKSGKALYHVDRVVRETGEIVDNGFYEIYVNAEVNDNSDVARLMEIFTKDDAYDDVKFPATSSRKRLFKHTEEGVSEMCEIIEKYKAEGKAEGIAEGRAKGKVEGRIEGLLQMAVSLWKKGKLTEQEAADEAGISLEEFKKAAASGVIV